MVADVDFTDCVELQPEFKRLKLRKNNWDSDTYESMMCSLSLHHRSVLQPSRRREAASAVPEIPAGILGTSIRLFPSTSLASLPRRLSLQNYLPNMIFPPQIEFPKTTIQAFKTTIQASKTTIRASKMNRHRSCTRIINISIQCFIVIFFNLQSSGFVIIFFNLQSNASIVQSIFLQPSIHLPGYLGYILHKVKSTLREDVVSLAQTKDEPEAAAKRLTETVFNCGSCDNITCIIVKPNHNPATKPECQNESETKRQSQIEIKGEAQSKTGNQG
ncbi:Protein phosphatase 2C (PP2C)-like protein [Cynara cardunculus var. scolymus]|uniref:Protein phosphatase 2C (PP2C)-like protein n=1 Tax=Cynara cardunculus var. scolymus TaxID=59895 RepID=A0A118K2I9_CYNCS|nr:Protein phosphatase 2C (PP2C)-like protein [Cynara cardunculus var. scolymus]